MSEEEEEVELLDLRALILLEKKCREDEENGLCNDSLRFSFSRLRSSSIVTGFRMGASGNRSNRSVAKESFHSGFLFISNLLLTSEICATDLRPSFRRFISSVRSL